MQASVGNSAEKAIDAVIDGFGDAFMRKRFSAAAFEPDLLMEVFGLGPREMAENRQYWGSQLGRVWEGLLRAAWSASGVEAVFPKAGDPERPCDVVSGEWAVDAKYRLGSGDSGTLQKLAANGRRLAAGGWRPLLLVFRGDSLPSSLAAARSGGWEVLEGAAAFGFVRETLGFDVVSCLAARRGSFAVTD